MDAEFKEMVTTVCNRGGGWLNILTGLGKRKYKIHKYNCNMKSSRSR